MTDETAARSTGPYAIGSDHWPGLSKLVEEIGELNQVLGKILGTGGDVEHWDGTNLRDRVQQEMGDVYAALDFFGTENDLDQVAVAERRVHKANLFNRWHREQSNDSGTS